jgi:hypothetical protein
MARMKGLGVVSLVRLVKSLARSQGIEDVAASLGMKGSAVFEGRVLASTWYDYDDFAKLLLAACKLSGSTDPEFFENLGRVTAEVDMGGTLSPFRTIGGGGLRAFGRALRHVWKAYNDPGEIRVEDVGPNQSRIILEGAPHVIPEHCRLTGGWTARAMEIGGAKDVRVEHDRCVRRGDPCCSYRITWTG